MPIDFLVSFYRRAYQRDRSATANGDCRQRLAGRTAGLAKLCSSPGPGESWIAEPVLSANQLFR
jgi:hypothetical protein